MLHPKWNPLLLPEQGYHLQLQSCFELLPAKLAQLSIQSADPSEAQALQQLEQSVRHQLSRQAFYHAYLLLVQLQLFCQPQSQARSLLVRKIPGVSHSELLTIEKAIFSTEMLQQLQMVCRKVFQQYQHWFNDKPIAHAGKAGSAVIHRIWLGKNPDDQQLAEVALANRRIAANWPGQTVQHLLWTNNPSLLAQAGTRVHGVFEVRNIDHLLDHCKAYFQLARRVYSFIAWKQFAHASGILRLLVLFHFGGLYLDFTWVNDQHQQPGPFEPDQASVMLYQKPIPSGMKKGFYHRPLIWEHTGQNIEYFIDHYHMRDQPETSEGFVEADYFIDNNVIYIGHPHSQFIIDALALLNDCFSSKAFEGQYAAFLRTMHLNKKPAGTDIYHEIAASVNPGMASLYFGLIFPSMKHFYQATASNKIQLPAECCFYIGEDQKRNKTLPSLGLIKLDQRSWNRVNPKIQGCIEAPW